MPITYDTILGKIRAAEHPISQDEIHALFGSETPDQPQGGILMDAAADSPTSMAATAGSAKVSSPSSQTANKKAVKLNASGYIEIAPLPGQVFLPGDQLSVTLYNQASGSKLMGFRLGSTQATPYTGDGINTTGRKNKTLTLLLTADMLNSGNRLLLYRYSSDAWFVAIRVQRA